MSGYHEGLLSSLDDPEGLAQSLTDHEICGVEAEPFVAGDPEDRAEAERLGRLISTLEGEIIPRLMLAHREPGSLPAAASGPRRPVTGEDVDELTRLVLAQDCAAAMDWCRDRVNDGVSVASVYLELLAPVARRLGEMWVNDECGFTDVTIGLCRLHQVLRDLGPSFRDTRRGAVQGRRALLLPAPGEQHMFGAVMVAEFFRRTGPQYDVPDYNLPPEVAAQQHWALHKAARPPELTR